MPHVSKAELFLSLCFQAMSILRKISNAFYWSHRGILLFEGYGRVKYKQASKDNVYPLGLGQMCVEVDPEPLRWRGHVSEQIFLICIYISALSLFPVQSTVEFN
jgi:hypothetical protein